MYNIKGNKAERIEAITLMETTRIEPGQSKINRETDF